jgi:hypothetical protein
MLTNPVLQEMLIDITNNEKGSIEDEVKFHLLY